MSFAVRFRRELTAGVCVGVSLPAGADFALPSGLHPDEAAFVHASPAARRATFIGGRVALRTALAALDADAGSGAAPILSTPRGAPALPAGFVGSVSQQARARRRDRGARGGDAAHDARDRRRDPRARYARTSRTRADACGARAVDTLDPAARDAEVLFRFAAKEAIYKALDPWVQRLVSFQEVES